MRPDLRSTLIVLLLLGSAGCAARRPADAPERYSWPERRSWSRAAVSALKDPGTWIPAAGAGAIAIGGWDDEISDWAVEDTPVFGSTSSAKEASDYLLVGSWLGMMSTGLAAPRGDGPWETRWGRVVVGNGSTLTARLTAGAFKELTGRERPDGSNDNSMPSGHASQAFAHAAMTRYFIDDLQIAPPAKKTLKVGFTTLAAFASWGRVEGGKHYATDILVGSALGNFISHLLHDAFLGSPQNLQIEVDLSRQHSEVRLSLRWPRRPPRHGER